ncbi:MAG: PKD domain-containing protein [Bacteroidales bacterium]|nr:PKD domain-containing protein [Bacteroidales bacterium]
MKKSIFRISFILLFILGIFVNVNAQVNISLGNTITEEFSIGTSATATLPAGWKMDKSALVRTLGSYSAAVTVTERSGGNNLSTTAANGIYNFGAGEAGTATDRAVGGLSSSSASKSVNVYVQLVNNGASLINNLSISYNVEKYRNGSNAAGFSIQMYYSTNGTDWTSAGNDFLTSIAGNDNNNGFASAPGLTVSITNTTLGQAIVPGGSLYLAWNYSVTSGTTTSNAQALGIDDVSITANAGGNVPPLITNILTNPSDAIGSGTTVHVSADVTDVDGTVSGAELHWGTISGTLSTTIAMSGVGNTYTTVTPIPAQPEGTTVYYEVNATDDDNDESTSAELSYTVLDPNTTTLPYAEAFTANLGDTYVFSVSGTTRVWAHAAEGYAFINGFNTGEVEEDWLILPGINLNNYSNEVITFDTWKRYGSENTDNYLKLMYSTNYAGTGSPASATWTELPFTQPASEQVWTFSGNIDLSFITGSSVWIAFKYRYGAGYYRLWQVDNIAIQEVDVEDPMSLSAVAAGSGQINLTFSANAGGDNVVIVYNETGVFTEPAGAPPVAGNAFAGGTLLYNGTLSPQSHTGLNPLQTVYYKAFSYNGAVYSNGLNANATTFAAEPVNYPTLFTAVSNSSSTITLSWTDAIPAADGYLIKGSPAGFGSIAAPVDGMSVADGYLVKNVAAGSGTYEFTMLSSSNTYYFKIFPYNGSTATINYKTDGSIPEASAMTLSGPPALPANWTFEPLQGTTTNPLSNTGVGYASYFGSFSGPGTATGMNTATGCGNQTSGTFAWSFSLANPGTVNESSGVQFNASTLGSSGIVFQFEQRWSSTATNTIRVQYTIDGANWINFNMDDNNTTYCNGSLNDGRFQTNTTADQFRRITVDFSDIPAVNNNPNFGVRVVAAHYQATGQFRQVGNPNNIATGGTWRFDNVVIRTSPVKLVVLSVNGGESPTINTPFSLDVQSQDAMDMPSAVTEPTTITLTLATGTGTLGGTLSAVLAAGQSTIVFNNVLYDIAESGVSITASATAGTTLTAGTSVLFTVLPVATQLSFEQVPAYGQTNVPVNNIIVHALRPDNLLDENYTGQITLSKASGIGNIGGTLVRNAVAGIATFSDISFDTEGEYTLFADATGLSQALSEPIQVLDPPILTDVIVPQYIAANEPVNHRIPYGFRVSISGLIPNAIYKYINQVVDESDNANVNGAGNMIIVTPEGDFIRTTNPDFTTEGNHGLFTTDASGSYTGWFVTEPTGNDRFTAGNEVFMRVRLNDGLGGNTVLNRLTTSSTATVLMLSENATAENATGIVGKAFGGSGDFAFLYDNVNGTGRPLSGTFVEDDGTSGGTSYAPFYQTYADGLEGSFGTLIPNLLENGVRRVEIRNRANGAVNASETLTSADGLWPYGINTVNSTGGVNALLVTEQPDFVADVLEIAPGESVNFTSFAPYEPNTYLWEFIGGAPGTTDNPNPTVSYYNEGEWDVTLTLTNDFGQEVMFRPAYILVIDIPVANFYGEPLIINPGGEVVFTDLSEGMISSWSWTFTGGEPATFDGQTPPAIVYNQEGIFDVSLTVSNDQGSSTMTMTGYVQVGLAPVADFDASFEIIDFEAVYTFEDLSDNEPLTWDWEFEAGNPATSDEQNPTVVYTEDGEYDVSLTVSNIFGEDTETKLGFVVVDLVSLRENDFVQVMNISPNPANGVVTIKTMQPGTSIRLLSTTGTVLLNVMVSDGEFRFDSKLFAPGLYVVEGIVPGKNKVVRAKLIVN